MSKKRPNILWYCTDQQRFDTIAALGNKYVRTPTIDQLVKQGVSFVNTYCQSPICTPSRSSFMTGLYPSRAHNTRNGNDTFNHPPLVSKMIADSGYDCGMIGKFHLLSSGRRTEPRLEDGFSYWKFSHAPRDDWESGHDYADWVKKQGGDLEEMRNSPEHVHPHLHQTKWSTDMAIDFVNSKRKEDQPWMLNINIYDPHPPFIPPQEYAQQFRAEDMPGPYFRESDLAQQEKLSACDFQGEIKTPKGHDAFQAQANYYAMISQIDDQLARLLKHLEDIGERDNTLVVFTSDHGEALGDHGLMWKGCRFYEGLVKVPLIISYPQEFKEDLVADGLVELFDMSATLLEVAGVELPEYFQGQSLMPVLKGDCDGEFIRDAVRCEYFDALDVNFTGGSGTFATMYREGNYKLSMYHNKNLGELYDLDKDPWEFENLWDDSDYAEIKNNLIYKSFNNHVINTTDVGSERIAPM